MDRKKKHRKPIFVSESPSEIITRIHAVTEDPELTDLQKCQALNRIEMQVQRQYGFFSQRFRELRQIIDHCRQGLQAESRAEASCYEHDNSGVTCLPDP